MAAIIKMTRIVKMPMMDMIEWMNKMSRIIRMASKKYIKSNNVTTRYLHNNHVAINKEEPIILTRKSKVINKIRTQ